MPWTFDTVALWADYGSSEVDLFSDYQAQFAAKTYDIISLEKCLGKTGQTGIYTEESFYKSAAQIRQYANSSETKIVFYWHATACYCDCYEHTQYILTNDSMWLYDDAGMLLY